MTGAKARPHPGVGRRPLLRLSLPVLRLAVRAFLFVMGRTRCRGAYRVPRRGPLIVIANHRSYVDPPLIAAHCPRHIHFMATKELWDVPWLRPSLRFFGAFPVDRDRPDRRALRHALELLEAEEVVGIFPEGRLNDTEEALLPLLPGAAMLARRSGATLICCGLVNTDGLIPPTSTLIRPSRRPVSITWGEPRRFGPESDEAEIQAWIEGNLRGLIEPD